MVRMGECHSWQGHGRFVDKLLPPVKEHIQIEFLGD